MDVYFKIQQMALHASMIHVDVDRSDSGSRSLSVLAHTNFIYH